MCGIAGFLHTAPGRPAERDTLQRMTRTLVHRGPDGEGFMVNGPAALGMRRLAIIDVTGGDQPMYNDDRSVALVQNGEIYNYRELREELKRAGHRFTTQSDTEVLVRAYEQWGEQFVEHLNGMWAIAVWDSKRQRLLLSRDRLGIKPLYYAWDGERLCFGSEIKALLEAPIPIEPNLEVLDAYVAFGFVPEPYSMYRGVSRLLPGHNLSLTPGGTPQLSRYWDIPTVPEKDARRDEARIVEEFTALLEDAVRLQLRSDVPLGAFLSGGLDSSSIAALAAGHIAEPLRTFTIGFDEPAYDERDLARLVADRYATQHHERVVDPSEFEAAVSVLGVAFDEPFGDSSALAAYVVSGIAREHVTVTLTGDGGDEVLAGYTRYQGEKFSQSFAALPGFVRRRLVPGCLGATRSILRGSLRYKADRAADVVDAANMRFEDRVTRKQAFSSARARRALLHANPQVRPAHEFVEEVMRDCPSPDSFHRLNWFDFKMMLPSQMLTKVDRTSMAQSIEARVPFLDHRLVELMVPVSARVKLPGYTRKHVLRKSMASRLPAPLMHASKKGFNVPMREWFQDGNVRAIFEQRMRSGVLDDWVDASAVQSLMREHSARSADHAAQLWILLQLANWSQKHHGVLA